jgi:adenosylhomocysteinase
MQHLLAEYKKSQLSPGVTRYAKRSILYRHFWLINNGNAANFMHGAVIGPAIRLIEGEKLVALGMLADEMVQRPSTTKLAELDAVTRRKIASIWSAHYIPE